MKLSPIIIIGAGPAGLMAAQRLAERGHEVHIYEQNKAAARKFLVAGHGGFNLTHSEAVDDFIQKYDRTEIQHIVKQFDNIAVINWLKSIGIETYTGSSGKIFPLKNIKPIQVLNAWIVKLQSLGVRIHYEHRMLHFNENEVTLEYQGKPILQKFAKLVFALGGGSWAKTGSDAEWIKLFEQKNISINPLQPANSGYNTIVDYTELEGQIIKNIEVRFGDIRKKGEVVFTNYGIEGSPIYYLNRFTRASSFPYTIYLDLKPAWTENDIFIALTKQQKTTEILKNKLKLNKTAIALLRKLGKEDFINPESLSKFIKNYPLKVNSFRPIDEVISTADRKSVV